MIMRAIDRKAWWLIAAVLLNACAASGGQPADQPPPTATPTPPSCVPERISDEDSKHLALAMGSIIELQPGASRQLQVGVVRCCYVFQPIKACPSWSISPGQGATIDPATGLVAVDKSTPNGSVFTVSAKLGAGPRTVTIDVHVFNPQDNPLVGIWREDVQFACGTQTEVSPAEPIRELQFKADGTFTVTWHPFEVYHDYWGSYTFDQASHRLDLVIDEGNYIPNDAAGSGTFSIDASGRLLLSDLWLGSPRDAQSPANCGHRFKH
jgi:hypothetical protein